MVESFIPNKWQKTHGRFYKTMFYQETAINIEKAPQGVYFSRRYLEWNQNQWEEEEWMWPADWAVCKAMCHGDKPPTSIIRWSGSQWKFQAAGFWSIDGEGEIWSMGSPLMINLSSGWYEACTHHTWCIWESRLCARAKRLIKWIFACAFIVMCTHTHIHTIKTSCFDWKLQPVCLKTHCSRTKPPSLVGPLILLPISHFPLFVAGEQQILQMSWCPLGAFVWMEI